MLGGTKNVTLLKNRFKVEIAIWRARNATQGCRVAGNLDPQVAMQGNEAFGLGKVFCDV